MKEQEVLRLLDGIDEDMLEEAENYDGHKKQGRGYLKYALVAAGLIAAFGIGYFSRVGKDNKQEQPSDYGIAGSSQTEDISLARGDYEKETKPEEVTIEPNETVTVAGSNEEYLIVYNPDTKVVELNTNKKSEYNRSYVHAVKNHWINMQAVFAEVDRLVELGEIPNEEVYYLVELDISTCVDFSTLYQEIIFDEPQYMYLPDEAVIEAEYERLTKECGYELNWLPPGGYQIPNSYLYCLLYGRIYGALTKEEIINLPKLEEYGYTIRLAAASYYEMADWEYRESYTEAELKISQWHSMRSFE